MDTIEQHIEEASAPELRRMAQLSRQGGVLLVLEDRGRISLEGHGRNLPGATALRALSVVLNDQGERIMLAVYDQAVKLRPNRAIVDATVKQAAREPLAPKIEELPPEPVTIEPEEEEDNDGATVEEAMTVEELRGDLRDLVPNVDDWIDALTPSNSTPEARRDTLDVIDHLTQRLAVMRQRIEEAR